MGSAVVLEFQDGDVFEGVELTPDKLSELAEVGTEVGEVVGEVGEHVWAEGQDNVAFGVSAAGLGLELEEAERGAMGAGPLVAAEGED